MSNAPTKKAVKKKAAPKKKPNPNPAKSFPGQAKMAVLEAKIDEYAGLLEKEEKRKDEIELLRLENEFLRKTMEIDPTVNLSVDKKIFIGIPVGEKEEVQLFNVDRIHRIYKDGKYGAINLGGEKNFTTSMKFKKLVKFLMKAVSVSENK